MNKEYTFVSVDFDPFASGELEKIIPAIEPQQEIWTACMIGGPDANRAYNESISLQLQGPFRRNAMEQALRDIFSRHESLRATISADGKDLCIRDGNALDISWQDLTHLDAGEQDQSLQAFATNDMHAVFDLQNGPLFRVALFRLAADRHHLRLTAHHIVCDGWSFGIILEDLGTLYSAYVKGETPVLEPADSFSTYATEITAYSTSAEYSNAENYWLRQYQGHAPELTLPTDRPRPAIRTYKSRRDDFNLDPSLLEAIKKTGAKAGSSLVSTLMVAFEVYLHHITGQNDIILGLPTAGQSATGHLNLVGHCVNLLPLRSRPDGDQSFIDYLRLRRKQLLDDYDHQQFTFGTLLQKLKIDRDSSRVPLVPVIFNIDAGMDSRVSFHQLSHHLISNPREFENFEIFLNATGSQQSMTLEWSYNTTLFNPETIRSMMGTFETLLRRIVDNPSTLIRDLPAQDPNEIRLLSAWNATQTDFPRHKSTGDLLHEAALHNSTRTAVRLASNDLSLTYHQLDQKASRFAAFLQQQGVQKGDIVALAADRSIDMVVALVAILRSGAAYLPLDPQFPKDRIEFMLADSKARLLLTSLAYKGHFNTDSPQLILEEIARLTVNGPDSFNGPAINDNDVAYLLYTSGSTGKPKGVQVEHHSLVNLLTSMQKTPGITPTDRLLATTTISFDIATLEIFLPLISGAELIVADTASVKDGRLLARLLDDTQATIMQATPSGWRILLDADTKRRPHLKAFTGGEGLPKELADRLLAVTGSLWNMYAPTETTIYSTAKQITAADTIITIGRPIDNTQVYILDPHGHPTPIGTPGEIVIAGEGVARGYLGRPELTAEKFIPDPFARQPGLRMYRTGDLGKFLPDGLIQCLGRIDQQVKIRGYRIEPGEIEHSLIKQPFVKEAVVIAREDNPGDQRLVAYLVAPGASEQLIPDWKKALAASLPGYMVPADFVLMESLPRTNNNKIDRKSLPKPVKNAASDANVFISPRTNTEKLVARIWAKALNTDNIGVDSNFFELGGHSLIAVKIMMALEKETGLSLPITLLFTNPTVGSLALAIAPDDAPDEGNSHSSPTADGSASAMPDEEPTDASPITMMDVPTVEPQKEIWLACALGGDNASRAYNIGLSEHFHGPFNRAAMERALRNLVDRHDSLRATFSEDGNLMRIASRATVPLNYQDISNMSETDRQTFIDDLSRKNAQTVFDLTNGPLFRLTLLRLSPIHHYLDVAAHHIMFDGWSYGVVIKELGALYSAYVQGIEPNLPPAPDFSQYALDENRYYNSPGYQRTEQYWMDQFKTGTPVLHLPTDYPHPQKRTYKGGRVFYYLDEQLATTLRKTMAKANTGLATGLRAALEVFLYRLTGQDDLTTGLLVAGQLTQEDDNLVGHCVNLLPIRANLNGSESFAAYLDRRKLDILTAFSNQRYTFGSLLKKLNVSRNRAKSTLVSVVLNTDFSEEESSLFQGLTNRTGSTEFQKAFENFEFSLDITDYRNGIAVRWDYNIDLFTPETIRLLHNRFKHLLQQVASNPEIVLDRITLPDAHEVAEQTRLLKEWNDTAVTYTKDRTTAQWISDVAGRYPNKTAVRLGSDALSYQQLDQKASRFAAFLQQQGIQKGDIVALAADRSVDMIVALLAILRSGAAYLPLDPQFPKDRIEFMLHDSKASLLLTSLPYKGAFTTNARQLTLEEINPLVAHHSDPFNAPSINGNDLAYVLYTSGSTGKPKGVQVEHHNLINFLASMQKTPGITAGDRLLAVTTISFDIAGLELYLPLITGAELILADKDTVKDGRLLSALLDDTHATIMQATPSGWRILLDADPRKRPQLKALCGGEGLPKDLADRLLASTQSLWNLYGPTETTIWSSVKQITPADTLITIGRPIDNTQIYILDAHGHPTPTGIPGEIVIAGDGVARGYLGRPELTTEKFVPDTFAAHPGLRMYRTGDLGKFLPNGELQCLGRIDQQVKVRGYRIEPGEIEHALIRLQPIKEAVVIAREDNPGDQRLVAYLVAPGASDQIIPDWKKALKASLPDYMIPSDYVLMESFPKTNNNKIDRKSLPKPIYSAGPVGDAFIAPRTDTERLVARIWSEALGIEKISINADFFELGGHSLVAVKVMVAIEKETGRRLPLATLFENSTIEKLALMVTVEEEQIKWDSLVPIKTTGNKIPIYLIHGHGLNVLTFSAMGKYMDEDQPVYALQALGLNGKAQLLYTIEEIAAKYNSEILEKNPNGPFALAGYSLGGLIAFEMSKQLMAMGKEVVMLGILDTYVGNRDITETRFTRMHKKVIRQFRKLAFFTKSFFRSPKTIIDYQSMILGEKIRNIFVRGYHVQNEFFTYEQEINRSYDTAYNNYYMNPMDVEVDLFRVEKRINYIDDPVYLEWDKFAKKGVSIHVVPGDHKTFLFPPHDKVFAQVLQECLNARQTKKVQRQESITKQSVLRAV